MTGIQTFQGLCVMLEENEHSDILYILSMHVKKLILTSKRIKYNV